MGSHHLTAQQTSQPEFVPKKFQNSSIMKAAAPLIPLILLVVCLTRIYYHETDSYLVSPVDQTLDGPFDQNQSKTKMWMAIKKEYFKEEVEKIKKEENGEEMITGFGFLAESGEEESCEGSSNTAEVSQELPQDEESSEVSQEQPQEEELSEVSQEQPQEKKSSEVFQEQPQEESFEVSQEQFPSDKLRTRALVALLIFLIVFLSMRVASPLLLPVVSLIMNVADHLLSPAMEVAMVVNTLLLLPVVSSLRRVATILLLPFTRLSTEVVTDLTSVLLLPVLSFSMKVTTLLILLLSCLTMKVSSLLILLVASLPLMLAALLFVLVGCITMKVADRHAEFLEAEVSDQNQNSTHLKPGSDEIASRIVRIETLTSRSF